MCDRFFPDEPEYDIEILEWIVEEDYTVEWEYVWGVKLKEPVFLLVLGGYIEGFFAQNRQVVESCPPLNTTNAASLFIGIIIRLSLECYKIHFHRTRRYCLHALCT